MTEKLKIVHIISNLDSGGAEMMLYKLIVAMDAQRFESEVISLTDLGEVGPLLQARGVKVWTLDMGRTFPNPFTLVGLVRHLRQSRPDLVQTWMYHADLLGSIAARCAGSPPVVWGIHHNDVQPRMHKRRTLWVIRTCARFSGLPAHIVCCSAAAQRLHVKLGYPGDKIEIIPNGFDLDEFKPDPSARAQLLRELGLTDEAVLIGLPSRYHPLKDIPTFLIAAAQLASRAPNVHFVLCGPGLGMDNLQLRSSRDSLNLQRRCHLLGVRSDTPRLFASFDIATKPSLSEAFPLAVGEAMACGIPCVVTDTGDSAALVADCGRVVPVHDARALTDAWAELASSPDERRRLGIAARRRIERLYSLPQVTRRYEERYDQILFGLRGRSLQQNPHVS